MSLTYHSMNIERVCIRYATDDDNDDELCGVMVRAITEDIKPLLEIGPSVLERIQAQIDAAKAFRTECQRKDEGAPIYCTCGDPVEPGDTLCHGCRLDARERAGEHIVRVADLEAGTITEHNIEELCECPECVDAREERELDDRADERYEAKIADGYNK